MSDHLSWYRFYSAILDNELEIIKDGLFYLHTRSLTTPLEGAKTCLDLAAKLGHTAMVEIILSSPALEAVRVLHGLILVRKLITGAFLEACTYGHLDIVKSLLSYFERVCELNDTRYYKFLGAQCAARNGGMDVVMYLISEEDRSGARVVFRQAYDHGHDYRCLLRLSDTEKYSKLVFARKEMFDLYDFNIDNVRLLSESSRGSVLIQAAVSGRDDILQGIYDQCQWPEKQEQYEAALDSAVEKGRTRTCMVMVSRIWVRISFGERWEKRLILAVENDKTETVVFLLEQFVRPIVARKQSEHSNLGGLAKPSEKTKRKIKGDKGKSKKNNINIPEMTDTDIYNLQFIASLLKIAVFNNNLELVQLLTEYASVFRSSGSEIELCFNLAVQTGLPRIAVFFHERGYKTSLCRGIVKSKTASYHLPECYYASVTESNVVICELLLGELCTCWRGKLRNECLTRALNALVRTDNNLPTSCQESETCRLLPAWQSEILAILMRKFLHERKMDRVDPKGKMLKLSTKYWYDDKEVFRQCFNFAVINNAVGNRFPLLRWYDFVNVRHRFELHAVRLSSPNLFDICLIFQSMTGWTKTIISKRGLVMAMNHLSTENVQYLCRCANECGITLCEKMDHFPGTNGVLQINRLTSPLKLRSYCRISIRRYLRRVHEVGSLEDKVLMLYRDGTLPGKIVDFLLFRNDVPPQYLRNVKLNYERLDMDYQVFI